MEVAEVSRTKFDPYVIGNNIRDLREKRKMTQMKAAEEMDMSLCHYARIEEGSKGMSIQMLFRFINFFQKFYINTKFHTSDLNLNLI